LGSSCIYPKFADQPIKEEYLLTSPLEYTNEPYAIAKIAGIKMCESYYKQHGCNFISIMPTNLYGPNDNFHPDNSHVLPALLRKFHEAKQAICSVVNVWGTGKAKREFLHVDDLASAVVHLLSLSDPPDLVNVGSGEEISIRDLAELVADIVGFRGEIQTDPDQPDGTPRKLADITRIRDTGWEPAIQLSDGIKMAYNSFLEESAQGKLRVV